MRRSWRDPALWLGLLGSLLVLVGTTAACWVAPDFVARPFWASMSTLGTWPGRIVLLIGIVALAIAFVLARRSGRPGVLAGVWYAPLLVAPPVLSRDVYAYLDQGWLAANGNPYVTPMGVVSPFARLCDDFWRGTTTVYPPLTLKLQAGIVSLGQENPVLTILLMRLPVVAGLALIGWLAPRVARKVYGGVRDDARVRWLFLLNPLTVIHLVGGGHNDAVMIAMVVVACALATTRYGYLTGALAAGVAMSVKQPGLLAAPLVALIAWPSRDLARRLVRGIGATLLAIAGFVASTAATGLGFGWLKADGAPSRAYTQSPASLVRLAVQDIHPFRDGTVFSVVLAVTMLAFVGVVVWLWLTRWRTPLAIGAWGYLAFAALGPGLQPWYLLYSLVFVAMIRVRPRGVALVSAWVTSLVATNAFTDSWNVSTLWGFLGTLPVALAVGWFLWRPRAELVGSPSV